MLRAGVIMKNREKVDRNVVYNTDMGHCVCHVGLWCL